MAGIHIWGDSILKGVVFDELKNRYLILKENCVRQLAEHSLLPIENHARMGMTAPEALVELENCGMQRGDIALIEFGGNDCDLDWPLVAADPNADIAPRTTLEQFAASLTEWVRRLRTLGVQPLLVVPPPLHAQRYFDWVTRNLSREAVLEFLGDVQRIYRWQERYALAVCDVASALACPIINLRDAFIDRKHYERLLCIDGIHPNAEGHAVMLQTLTAALA